MVSIKFTPPPPEFLSNQFLFCYYYSNFRIKYIYFIHVYILGINIEFWLLNLGKFCPLFRYISCYTLHSLHCKYSKYILYSLLSKFRCWLYLIFSTGFTVSQFMQKIKHKNNNSKGMWGYIWMVLLIISYEGGSIAPPWFV